MQANKTKYTDVPEWDKLPLVEIKDTFPSLEELVRKPKLRKVTISLSEDSLEFFKSKAKELNSSYQHMIRALLDEYVRAKGDRK
jgi:predicted DNA binding CopG/RHH family protein